MTADCGGGNDCGVTAVVMVSHFTKCNTDSTVRAPSRIRLSEQVCFQKFCKSIQARGRPQINRQNIQTARTSHQKILIPNQSDDRHQAKKF